jgi:arginase family enzyme
VTLRLLWPQWQGAGTASVQALAPEFPFEVARRGYAVGSAVLGGECAVSVAPFSALARRYDDLAIVWIDSHPDIGTPASHYPGFHAMAVAALTGHGDPEVQQLLPAIVYADRVALVGLHAAHRRGHRRRLTLRALGMVMLLALRGTPAFGRLFCKSVGRG